LKRQPAAAARCHRAAVGAALSGGIGSAVPHEQVDLAIDDVE
jgi:hypothetical protein